MGHTADGGVRIVSATGRNKYGHEHALVVALSGPDVVHRAVEVLAAGHAGFYADEARNDSEGEAHRIRKPGDRALWLAEHGRTAEQVSLAHYMNWPDRLPAGPVDEDGNRGKPLPRGVYASMDSRYNRALSLSAVTAAGVELAEVRVPNDATARDDAARLLWALLDRADPPRYSDGYDDDDDDDSELA